VQLVVPPAPGRYTIRYFLSQDRTELASTTLEVTAPEVSLTAPATAVAGDTIEVGWVGPDYRDNYIGIGRADATRGDRWETFAYTREGQPLRVRVPATAGAYRVTYFLNQERTAMTSVPLTVTTPEANLVAPARAAAGSVVEIGWTGPDYRDDYIGIGRADATRGDRWQSFRYTRDGTPAKLQLPDQPGAYVIRYFMNLDRTVLAEVPIVLE
jgi:Ca-activated chloride channel family protein